MAVSKSPYIKEEMDHLFIHSLTQLINHFGRVCTASRHVLGMGGRNLGWAPTIAPVKLGG